MHPIHMCGDSYLFGYAAVSAAASLPLSVTVVKRPVEPNVDVRLASAVEFRPAAMTRAPMASVTADGRASEEAGGWSDDDDVAGLDPYVC